MEKKINRLFLLPFSFTLVLFLTNCVFRHNYSSVYNKSPQISRKAFKDVFSLEKEILLKGDEYCGNVEEVLFWNNKILVGDFSKNQKVVVYNGEGKQIGLLGKMGQGPGCYQGINLMVPFKDGIALFDPLKLSFIFFDKNLRFLKELNVRNKLKFFAPDWFSLLPGGDIAFYSPRSGDGGKRVFLFSSNFSFINSFGEDEKLSGQISFGGLKNICVDCEGRIWIAGFFFPLIEVFDRKGKKLFEIVDFCKRNDFMNIKKRNNLGFQKFLKEYYSKKGAIYGLFSYGNYIAVFYKIPYPVGNYIASKSYFSIYDKKGRLIVSDVELSGKVNFVNAWGNYFIFYKIPEEKKIDEGITGVLKLYRLKLNF